MKIHVAEQYAANILSDKIVACDLVKLAVRRYYNDLEYASDKGWHFDRKAAERAVSFIQKLRHTKGKFAGKPFILEGWQAFAIWNIFGWKFANGTRRFSEVYIEVARKNGKTTLSAGIALYMLYADGEARAEVYSVATKRDQAMICFNDAAAIVKATALRSRLNVGAKAITYEQTGSTMQPLSSDYDTQDGLNPSCGVIDEYHAHKNNGIYDVLTTATGAREQPLIFIITTAGKDQSTPCFHYRKNTINILRGTNCDDRLFAMIFTLDNESEVNNPDMWVKSNPNIGVSVKEDYLSSQLLKARNQPENYVNIMIKNFNVWMQGNDVWISDEVWQRCIGTTDPTILIGKECTGGLDLANVSDVAAFALEFHENGKVQSLVYFWIPENTLLSKVQKENINYDVWQRNGLIKATPGNVIDYDYIKADILKLAESYNINSIAYDRWNSSQIVIDLTNEGLVMTPFGQGYGSMSAPTKEFKTLILKETYEHFGNDVQRWMVGNCVTTSDPAGNIKVDKSKAVQKIDGVIAAIMAHGEHMTISADKKKKDPYTERGLLD